MHALTKPWPWLTLLGFFVVVKFDLGVFAEEVRETVWGLWPFVFLGIVLWFVLHALPIVLKHLRDKNKR